MAFWLIAQFFAQIYNKNCECGLMAQGVQAQGVVATT
jgi:hypothetical protein